jgi:hypothetical protein
MIPIRHLQDTHQGKKLKKITHGISKSETFTSASVSFFEMLHRILLVVSTPPTMLGISLEVFYDNLNLPNH